MDIWRKDEGGYSGGRLRIMWLETRKQSSSLDVQLKRVARIKFCSFPRISVFGHSLVALESRYSYDLNLGPDRVHGRCFPTSEHAAKGLLNENRWKTGHHHTSTCSAVRRPLRLQHASSDT